MMIISAKPLFTKDLGKLFTLSNGDIKLIKARVKACINGKHAVEVISRKLPAFREALVAAEQWERTLFPEMKNLSRGLDVYAKEVINNMSDFNDQVSELDPDAEDLPLVLKLNAVRMITLLKSITHDFYIRFEKLAPELVSFINANKALDSDILKKDLGFMTMIKENLVDLEKANGLVRGQWNALYDDLDNLSHIDADNLNMPFVAGLEIEAAIQGWKDLRAECALFIKNNE